MRALYVLFLLVVVAQSSCTTTRPRPSEQPALLAARPDSLSLDSLAKLPPYLVPPPAGSTRAQARRWQKAQTKNLAGAGLAPQSVKIKHSTLATGAGATAVTAAKNTGVGTAARATAPAVGKAKAPVALGPAAVATDQRKAAQRGGALAAGDGAQATAVTEKPFPWWIIVVVGALLGLNKLIRGRWLL
jgi:hypothetical protein